MDRPLLLIIDRLCLDLKTALQNSSFTARSDRQLICPKAVSIPVWLGLMSIYQNYDSNLTFPCRDCVAILIQISMSVTLWHRQLIPVSHLT